jgi:hypothetical protein
MKYKNIIYFLFFDTKLDEQYVKYPFLALGKILRLIRRTLNLNIPKKYYFLPSMFCFHLILTVFEQKMASTREGKNVIIFT